MHQHRALEMIDTEHSLSVSNIVILASAGFKVTRGGAAPENLNPAWKDLVISIMLSLMSVTLNMKLDLEESKVKVWEPGSI